MKRKKRYSSEEKTMILREHLEKRQSVSELTEKYGINPNAIYQWKKQMFETTPNNLSKRTNQTKTHEKQIKYLQSETFYSEHNKYIIQKQVIQKNLYH